MPEQRLGVGLTRVSLSSLRPCAIVANVRPSGSAAPAGEEARTRGMYRRRLTVTARMALSSKGDERIPERKQRTA
jgi:hypothetical protein